MSFSPMRTIVGSLLLMALVLPSNIISEAQIVFPGQQPPDSPQQPPESLPQLPPPNEGPSVVNPIPDPRVGGVSNRTHNAGVGATLSKPKVGSQRQGGTALLFFPREELLPKVRTLVPDLMKLLKLSSLAMAGCIST